MRPDDVRVVRARPDAIDIVTVPGDHPIMSQVRDLCYEALHRPFGVPRDDRWNEMDPASTHLAAVEGDRLVGYVRLIDERGTGHVRQVVVAPSHRGRGIASDLVSCAVETAVARGLPRAYLNARERAVGVYARQGFRVVTGPFRMGRTYLKHVRMELPLR